MLYKTLSAAVYGIDASIIEVEVDVSGIKTMEDHFHTVGLPDAAVRESRDRVRAALKNCGVGQADSMEVVFHCLNSRHVDLDLDNAGIDAINCGTQRLIEHGAYETWICASGKQICSDLS